MTDIITATEADIGPLSEVMAEAFFDLPPSPWLISDQTARRRIFPGYFRIYLEHALAAGIVHTTPGRDAAALWIPFGAEPPEPPAGYEARLLAATTPWTPRFSAFDTAIDGAHPAGTPHEHLAILAVQPGRQGQGTGTALLNARHRVLDDAGIPAYLEASSRRNHDLYLRHGYADHGPPIQLPDGPSMYPMWRAPR
jgi:GNAT superfamily N-acetyltransferase